MASPHPKCASGSQKRKAKAEKEKRHTEAMKNVPSISTMFSRTRAAETMETETQPSPPSPSISDTAVDSVPVDAPPSPQPVTPITSPVKEASNEPCISVDSSDIGVELVNSTDLGQWPLILDEASRSFWISKGSDQCRHVNSDFSETKSLFSDGKTTTLRSCKPSFFWKVHSKSKEKIERSWLCYSVSKKALFCFPCKLMHTLSNEVPSKLVEGFCDWKHAIERLSTHESSQRHRKSVSDIVKRRDSNEIVNKQIVAQLESEQKYWRQLLQRLVDVIKHLATRGGSFRGSNEVIGSVSNGNYLGTLELLAKYDPFLAEHIKLYGNKGSGTVSYLSSTVCDELIAVMGNQVLSQIVGELKQSKYFSISLDSTPDVSHVDQLSFTIRYVLPSGPIERFVSFLGMRGHCAADLLKSLTDFLQEHQIDISNCRGQSYDNASNMSGKYNGLQAKVKELCPYADYVPCAAHSLNLVGVCAAESCPEVCRFFMFVESIYNFFSASTHRWALLTAALDGKSVVKKLSDTRWSARADSCKALRSGYKCIIEALTEFSADPEETKYWPESQGILSLMNRLETAVLLVFWDSILSRFNLASKELQKSGQDLSTACSLYESLIKFVEEKRESYDDIEKEAMALSESSMYAEELKRPRKRNRRYDDASGSTQKDAFVDSMTTRERFRTSVFLVAVDRLLSALTKRLNAYSSMSQRFGFLRSLPSLSPQDLRQNANQLVSAYPNDLEADLFDELQHFRGMLHEPCVKEVDMHQLINKHDLRSCFPNVEIALRMYLSVMVSNCTGERSFSRLKRIKDALRNSMGQDRLNNLALMCIEHELTNELSFNDVLDEFAFRKARKAAL